MYKPPISDPFAQPTSVERLITASNDWWTNNASSDIAGLANSIVDSHQGDIAQLVMAARMARSVDFQRVQRQWPDLRVELTYNSGQESLRLTVYPENSGGGKSSSTTTGGVFDVKADFTGFPLPGMGTDSRGWPTYFQLNGPLYPFDPMFSPNTPGDKSQVDTSTGFLTCVNPTTVDDWSSGLLDYSTQISVSYTTETVGADGVTPVVNVDHNPDISSFYCKGVGGSAILTTPLTGKQYWEVEIVTLPGGRVPSQYTVDTVTGLGNMNPMFWTQQHWNAFTVVWPEKLDSFGTPSIGVCTEAYLPTDLQTAGVSDRPKKFKDLTRPLGLDPPIDPAGAKNLLARSVYLTNQSRASERVPVQKQWIPGVWEIGISVVKDNQQFATDQAKLVAKLESYDPSQGGDYPTIDPVKVGDPAWRILCPDNYAVTPPPGHPQPKPVPVTVQSGQWITNGDTVYFCMGSWQVNPPATSPGDQPILPKFSSGAASAAIFNPSSGAWLNGTAMSFAVIDWPDDALWTALISPSAKISEAQYTIPSVGPPPGNPVWTDQLPAGYAGFNYGTFTQWPATGGTNWLQAQSGQSFILSPGSTDVQSVFPEIPTLFVLPTGGSPYTTGYETVQWASPTMGDPKKFTPISQGAGSQVYPDPQLLALYGYNQVIPQVAVVTGLTTYHYVAQPTPTFTDPATGNQYPPSDMTNMFKVRYTPGLMGYPSDQSDDWCCAGDFIAAVDVPENKGVKADTLVKDASPDILNSYEDGYHSPVYIGRIDQFAIDTSVKASNVPLPGDGGSLPLDGSLSTSGSGVGRVGQYTGVDLGALVVGDRIMIATDMTTGYIWFGKNGTWYGADHQGDVCQPLGASDGPAKGTRWTAIMDGAKKSSTPVTPSPGDTTPANQPPRYFPAVGWRVGPMEAKMHYSQGLKYAPPRGFKPYGQSTLAY